MRKACISIVGLLIVLCLVMGGCYKATAQDYKPPYNITWISYPLVEVEGFYAGGRAEHIVQIHNGNITNYEERKLVTTEPLETKAPIPMKNRLFGKPEGIRLTSNLAENLTVVGYDDVKREILIDGFLPETTRELTISYPRYTTYNVVPRLPDHPYEGYVAGTPEMLQYITISEKNPDFTPGETKDIMIILDVPQNVVIPSGKWEFWISVTEGENTAQIMTELCQRWLIKNKG